MLRTFASSLGRGRFYPTLLIYLVAFSLVTSLIQLPLSYYVGYVREHAFGLSTQHLSKWIGDQVKGAAGRAGHRRADPLAALPVAGAQPVALVALDRRAVAAAHRHHVPGHADLDRAAVQQVRPDAGQGAGSRRAGDRVARRRRGRARLPGRQERRHREGQRLRDRHRQHQAHRPVGHAAPAPVAAADPLRRRSRARSLRARTRRGQHLRLVGAALARPLRRASHRRSAALALRRALRVHASSPTWRRCRCSCCCSRCSRC